MPNYWNQIKSLLPTFGRKSDWQHDTPFYTPSAIYDKEFSVINLPSQFFRRGAISMRDALAHELIFACLTIKSLAVQDVLPIIQRFRANDWELDQTHPALPALRNPNPDNTFGDLLAFMAVCEDVFGVIYLEKIKNRTQGVIGLAPLDPRTVFERPKPGVPTFPTYWNAISCYRLSDIDHYTIEEGGASRRLEVEDVITIKAHDIRSPLAGHTAVYAAMRAIGVDQNLDKYIDAYLMAGGPSGVLKIKNRQLTDEEAQQVQERWEKRYSLKNGRQSGKVAVFDEDGDYQQIGAHLEGLASDTLKQHDQAAICTAMGVPGQLVEAFYAIRWGNQRAGQETAQQKFWENKLSPTLTRWRTRLDKSFLVDFDGRQAGITSRVFWDTSSVKALQEDIDKRAARYDKAYQSKAVSKNEYRAQLGLKPVPGGDFIPNDEESYQQAQERLNIQQDNQPDQGDQPNQDNQEDQKKTSAVGVTTIVLKTDQAQEAKAKRNPPAEEAEQIPAVEKAQNDAKEKLTAILLLIKAGLIQQAIEKLRQLSDQFASLNLSLTADQLHQINQAIEEAYQGGQLTIASLTSPPDSETVKGIASVLAGMLTTGVAARLVSAYALRKLRGKPAEEILTEIEAEANEESQAFYEQLASGAAFQAVADGRNNEANRRKYKRVYYSAILDKNVCDPCKSNDGKWSDDVRDLTPVPNPFCEGRWRCRCAHVYVFE